MIRAGQMAGGTIPSSVGDKVRPTATILLRQEPEYRLAAFEAGLQKCGYQILHKSPRRISAADVLVIWNRYQMTEQVANRFEANGATVLVVENGWVGSDRHRRPYYAVARHHHNGAGSWEIGPEDRLADLTVNLHDWRTSGEHILVLPQRGIGPPGVKMPTGWPSDIMRRLPKKTDRPIRMRPHPGKERPPLEPDFQNCWAAVTWGSGAAMHAIVAGVPVFHEMEKWIGAPAAVFGIDNLEAPFLGDRLPMLRRLAWHQWSTNEIQSGEPFKWLLK